MSDVDVQLIQVEEQETVVVDNTVYEIVSVGEQGPPGPMGPQGPAGDSVRVSYPASTILSGHIIAALKAPGVLEAASCDNPKHALTALGMTIGAVEQGAEGLVQTFGEFTETSWTWTPDLPIYLGLNGRLTQTPPAAPSAVFTLIVGIALAPTRAFIALQSPIFLTQE